MEIGLSEAKNAKSAYVRLRFTYVSTAEHCSPGKNVKSCIQDETK